MDPSRGFRGGFKVGGCHPQHLGGMLQSLPLLDAHFRLENVSGSGRAHNSGKRQGEVADPCCSLLNAGDRQHAAFVAQQAAQQVGGDESDCMVGRSLAPDDFVCGAAPRLRAPVGNLDASLASLSA